MMGRRGVVQNRTQHIAEAERAVTTNGEYIGNIIDWLVARSYPQGSGQSEIKTIDIFEIKSGGGLMTHAKTRAASARAREIELIHTRLAVLSELESALERDHATLRAQRGATLLRGFGGSRQSKIGRASCRLRAVPLPTKVVYPGLTKSP
jgi:hypothetical protein